jgi:putative photosynthetic complex assembly protein 2
VSAGTPVLPVLFALFVWWFSTGAILYLDGLPRRTHRWTMAGASALALLALYALHATAMDTGVAAAYAAFTAAILVWGWVEVAFLLGWVTGPRTSACPPGARGWRRAAFAFEAILWHEFALLGGALLIALATWEADNHLGLWAYLLLWLARLSTKLNLFLGVRNLGGELLPDHLRYLQSYFLHRPMNVLFPLSMALGVAATVLLWQAAHGAPAAGDAVALSLLATLATLAVLEHLFLVLPINVNALWEWSLWSRRVEPPATGT